MSKLDRIKREIDFHEKLFFGALAALLALVGWLASNYNVLPMLFVLLSLLVAVGLNTFGIYQYRRIKTLLEILENE